MNTEMYNPVEQLELLKTKAQSDPNPEKQTEQQSDEEKKISEEDDLHEIQVDDDIEEPDPENPEAIE
jgi:hypothetical protein